MGKIIKVDEDKLINILELYAAFVDCNKCPVTNKFCEDNCPVRGNYCDDSVKEWLSDIEVISDNKPSVELTVAQVINRIKMINEELQDVNVLWKKYDNNSMMGVKKDLESERDKLLAKEVM